ncbi:MAG: hypothetical protein AAGJ35_07365, partial [Myxococcota bacterium]
MKLIQMWSVCSLLCWGGWASAQTKASGAFSRTSEAFPLLKWMAYRLPRSYVDPTQFRPKQMFRAAMERLSLRVDDLWIRFEDADRFWVHVGTQRKRFSVGPCSNLFDIWIASQKVAGFLRKHYRGHVSWQ